MMERTEPRIKVRLRRMSAESAPPPQGPALRPLLSEMVRQLGALDPELRDELIYETFARWISSDQLSPDDLNNLRRTALDDRHLFHAITEPDERAVFMRSFSMLLLALLLDAHRRRPYLQPEEIEYTRQQVLCYLVLERDRRGYVEGHGWAHSVAHAADTLAVLAHLHELQAEDLRDLLFAIRSLAGETGLVYASGEDERLSVAVTAIFHRGLLERSVWEEWLEELVASTREDLPFLEGFRRQLNVKNLLRSVYFRLRRSKHESPLRLELVDRIEEALTAVTRG
jgi:hypothetical protein